MLPFVNVKFLIAIIYLGILCSVCGFVLYNLAISYIGTNRSASFCRYFHTYSGACRGVILKEQILSGQVVGMLLILCGVYIANRGYGYRPKDKRKKPKSWCRIKHKAKINTTCKIGSVALCLVKSRTGRKNPVDVKVVECI